MNLKSMKMEGIKGINLYLVSLNYSVGAGELYFGSCVC